MRDPMISGRFLLLITLGLLTALGGGFGCGRSRYPTVPVVGRVRFDGKAPPAACTLFFVPAGQSTDPNQPISPRPGRARTAADGGFTVSTFGKADGLVPGAYDVALECWRTPPRGEHDEEEISAGVSFVPAGFVPPRLVVPAAAVRAVRYELDVMVPTRR